MQNNFIEKNKKLVSRTKHINLKSINSQLPNGGHLSPYQTIKTKDKLQSIPLSGKKHLLIQDKYNLNPRSNKNSEKELLY